MLTRIYLINIVMFLAESRNLRKLKNNAVDSNIHDSHCPIYKQKSLTIIKGLVAAMKEHNAWRRAYRTSYQQSTYVYPVVDFSTSSVQASKSSRPRGEAWDIKVFLILFPLNGQ